MAADFRAVLGKALRSSGLHPNARINRFMRSRALPVYSRLTGTPPDWAIALYEGPSPLSLRPHRAVQNPVLTARDVCDVPAEFVADPFAIRVDHVWYLFFEVLNQDSGKGEIALAKSPDLQTWSYSGVVLEEPFHLSYPLVFEWNDDVYMLPETWEDGSVRLYRALGSLERWELIEVLLEGPVFLDSTAFHHDGSWWMFTETNERHAYDTLRLFMAPALRGPWHEHPQSPVVHGDAQKARPAGRVVVVGDRVIRLTQDCLNGYGRRIRAFEVVELSATRYRERPAELDVTRGPGTAWDVSAMHHADVHRVADGQWVAFVDGY